MHNSEAQNLTVVTEHGTDRTPRTVTFAVWEDALEFAEAIDTLSDGTVWPEPDPARYAGQFGELSSRAYSTRTRQNFALIYFDGEDHELRYRDS